MTDDRITDQRITAKIEGEVNWMGALWEARVLIFLPANNDDGDEIDKLWRAVDIKLADECLTSGWGCRARGMRCRSVYANSFYDYDDAIDWVTKKFYQVKDEFEKVVKKLSQRIQKRTKVLSCEVRMPYPLLDEEGEKQKEERGTTKKILSRLQGGVNGKVKRSSNQRGARAN